MSTFNIPGLDRPTSAVVVVDQNGAPAIGATDAAAYADDTGAADGSLTALLKGIYVQNAQIIALLTAIEQNTSA